ncbi:MAG: glycosyltransferase family 2 protein [Actinomycetota bacterium]|nr:glycosyltransferase family 2 protein [Actinomycetota bacterium]
MKLVMTLKIRDEGDVIDANLRFHLAAGVDFFIVTDNGSVDETPAILERYRKAGLAQVLEKPADEFYRPNPEWVTDMARLAATEHGADWVINNDADEFWWPLAGDLKAALESVPERYMAVAAPRPEFVARPDGPGAFYERMTIRERLSTVRPKLAHRAHPGIVAPSGAHRVALPGAGAPGHRGRPWLRSAVEDTIEAEGWLTPAPVFPMRILHYPVRSYDQYRRRVEISLAGERHTGDKRAQEIYAALKADRLEDVYANYAPGDEAVADAIGRGHLVEDTRIRDVIKSCPDFAADPALLADRRPLSGGASADEAAEVAEDGMHALLRSETLSVERLAQVRKESRRLDKKRKRLRKQNRRLRRRVRELQATPWRRARKAAGRALGRAPDAG